jgi:hypothetical protein
MNEFLISEYTEEEITKALDDMGDLKAPGLMECQPYFISGFGERWVIQW